MGVACRPIEPIWCAVKNPIAEFPVTQGGLIELMRRLTENFKTKVSDKVLAGSLRRTMEVEDKYLKHVADAAGIPQAPQDAESDEEDEPEDLDEALADEGDDFDEDDA